MAAAPTTTGSKRGHTETRTCLADQEDGGEGQRDRRPEVVRRDLTGRHRGDDRTDRQPAAAAHLRRP